MLNYLFKIYLKKRLQALSIEEDFYITNKHLSQEKKENIQLNKFNIIWRNSYENIPFYKNWKEKHNLPNKIYNLSQLEDFPVLTKKIISDNRNLVFKTPGIKRQTLTGGTSGIATPFPMNLSDADSAWINTFTGRSLNQIYPRSKLLMIWGHSHLFSGRHVILKDFRNKIKDYLNNITRVSAYDLSDKNLQKIINMIIKTKPKYIIGYGSCLKAILNFCTLNKIRLSAFKIRRIVNTSETLSDYDANKLEELFNCPVINEYGMAEAGVIGYSVSALYPINIFYRDFILFEKSKRIILTTIGQKCFPLINYDTEDLVCEDYNGSIYFLKSLAGKERDVIKIEDLDCKLHTISVIVLDHIFKQLDSLRSIHYSSKKNMLHIYFSYFGDRPSNSSLLEILVKGLKIEGIHLRKEIVKFIPIDEPIKTKAGKRKVIIKER